MSKAAATVDRQGRRLHIRDTFQPRPKQREFFWAADQPHLREVLYHGSIRAGKTQAACKKIVAWAMRYGGTYVVMRSTKQELEDSTKKVMLRGDGDLPPACPAELIRATSVTWNKVTLVNGAEIWFRSLEPDERGKIRNITVAGMFIDQAEELDEPDIEDFYDELLGRLSDPNGPQKMLLIANPGPETHWLCRRFGLTEETRIFRRADRYQVHTTLWDNKDNLDPRYFNALLQTRDERPDFYNRMVMGRWGAAAGKRFKCWRRSVNVVDHLPFTEIPEGWTVYEGGDWGHAHPLAWEWIAVDYEGALWCLAEHHEAERSVPYHARQIKKLRANENGLAGFEGSLEPAAAWLDPSAWNRQRQEVSSVADSFRDHGIYCARAQNERLGGWTRMEDYLTDIMPDGYSRLRFWAGGCPRAILEIPNLVIKTGTEDVEKKDDDAADAVRYVLMSRVPTPKERELEELALTRDAFVKRLLKRKDAERNPKNVMVPL